MITYPVGVGPKLEYLRKRGSYVEEVLHVPRYLSRQLDADLLLGLAHVAILNVLAVPLSIVPVKTKLYIHCTVFIEYKRIKNIFLYTT